MDGNRNMSDMTGLIEWPDYLPYPQQSGYKYTVSNKHKSVDVEDGTGKLFYNPDTTNRVEVTFILSEDQKTYFETWYQLVLLQGLKWFNCPLIAFDGDRVNNIPARQMPQTQREMTLLPGGLNYQVKMQLMTRPVDVLPLATLTYWPYYGGRDGFNTAADLLHQIVNYQAPVALTVPEI